MSGINHPVMNVLTGKENYIAKSWFSVNRRIKNHSDLEITHYHINDNTVAGMQMKSVFTFQYHPQ
jgi:carbamoyl-phosphate synthase small subunit